MPKPSNDPSEDQVETEKIYPVEKISSKPTPSLYTYMGTDSSADADALYASSVIDTSFKSCFESLDGNVKLGLDVVSKIMCEVEKAEAKSTRESIETVKSQAKERTSSVKNEIEVAAVRESKTVSATPTVTSSEKKSSKQNTEGSKDKTKRALVPLRLARRAQLSKKNKNKEPLVVNKNRLSRPPMPKIVKQKDELDMLVGDLNHEINGMPEKSTGRSHSTYSNVNYSFDDTLSRTKVKQKDRTFSEIGSRRSRDNNTEVSLSKIIFKCSVNIVHGQDWIC